MPSPGRIRVLSLSLAALALVALLAWWLTSRASDEPLAPARGSGGAASSPASSSPMPPPAGSSDAPTLPPSAELPLAPSDAANAATTGSLVVQVRWKADGSPAADIGLRLLELDRPDPLFHPILGRTGDDGRWTLDDRPPGRVIVYSDRVEAQGGWIVAGQRAELTIELLPGVLVRGTVVDSEQQPVAGAEIWLDGFNSPGALATVGRADNVGHFVVRDVRRGQSVGASASGHTRSGKVIVGGDTPDPFDVTLALCPPGGRIHGVVSDPDGRPVAEATVLLSSETGWGRCQPAAGSNLGFAPPIRLLSDERGVFAADDVPAGWMPVAVRATGWSPWSGEATVAVGETTEVPVALQPSASLTGVVRDDAGQPMADVHVAVEGRGQMGLQYDFSDAEGRFTLRDLPLGTVDLVAHRDGAGRAMTTFKFEPGAQYVWDPVLGTGVLIRGRIVDARGEPLGGCRISAVPEEGEGDVSDTKSDADGRFMLDDCSDSPHRLEVEAPNSTGPFPVVILTGVRPGPEELEIVVDLGTSATAVVVGRVEDAKGRPLGARLWLNQLETQREIEASSATATGTFRFGPLPAGRYTLEVAAEGLSGLELPEFELAAGEVRDLGAIVFETPGTLHVRAQLPDGVGAATLVGFMTGLQGQANAQLGLQADGTLLSSPLQPGDYRLKVWALRASMPDRPVRVDSGQQTEVDVVLSACVHLQARLSLPLREGPAPAVFVEIVDATGSTVLEQQALLTDHPDEGRRGALIGGCLPPSRYVLKVRCDDRLVLEEPLQLDTGKPAYFSTFELP